MKANQRGPRKRKPPPRVIRILSEAVADFPGLLHIGVGRQRQVYWYQPFDSDIGGQAVALRKFRSSDVYHVLIDGPHGTSCDCLGHERWGHCKHGDGLAALLRAGQL